MQGQDIICQANDTNYVTVKLETNGTDIMSKILWTSCQLIFSFFSGDGGEMKFKVVSYNSSLPDHGNIST